MDEEIAKLVIAAGAAVGVVVWLVTIQLYRKMADAPQYDVIEGRADGRTPAEAIRKLAESAARLPGHVRLERPAEDVLTITQMGMVARIAAYRERGQTLLTAELDDARFRRKMQVALAVLILVVMPAFIVGLAVALWYFAAPSNNPGARWQCIQVVQTVHVLWPPFLVYFLWKKQRAMLRDAMSNLLVVAGA